MFQPTIPSDRRRIAIAVCGWIFVGLSALTGMRAQEATPQSVEQEPWIRLAEGPLTVLSNAPTAKARDWALELESFRHSLQTALPLPNYVWQPVTVFMFDSDAALARFLPVKDGQVQKIRAYTASLAGRYVIALSLEWPRARTREILYHEAVHWFLRGLPTRPPVWLDEGLAVTFQTFALDGAWFRVGDPLPGFQALIRNSPPLPYEKVIAQRDVDHAGTGAPHSQTDLFYAEAWAMTHRQLFSAPAEGPEKVLRYVEALESGFTGDEAFRRGFGESVKEAETQVLEQIRSNRRLATRSWRLERSRTDAEFTVTAPGRGELQRSFALLLGGVGRYDASADFCRRGAELDPTAAWPWALGAYAAVAGGKIDNARRSLARAQQLRCDDALLYCAIGQAYTLKITTVPRTRDAGPSVSHAASAAEMFRTACRLQANLKPAFEGLAFVSVQTNTMGDEDRRLLQQGSVTFPHSGVVHMALGLDEINHNHRKEAGIRLRRVKPDARFRNDNERRMFEFLLATL